MRTAVLLLVCAVLAGCTRMQGVESEMTKSPPVVGQFSATSIGGSTQNSGLMSSSDATPEDLASALKQKGMDVELRLLPGSDRNGAAASLLTVRDPKVSAPSSVLIYSCANEELARELAGMIGADAFVTGRLAIGPSTQNKDNQALARKLRKTTD